MLRSLCIPVPLSSRTDRLTNRSILLLTVSLHILRENDIHGEAAVGEVSTVLDHTDTDELR
jgi:hypothetical protein